MNQQSAWAAVWHKSIIARYLTVAGATVDLKVDRPGSSYVDSIDCTGCGFHLPWMDVKFARQQAQEHAETCRALPRPQTS
ncbi:hypothetical protein ADK70_12555 [Streptomyces rimosus subsp. pseudoverticillatus]|uniref:hypothetical protein n=1 Tax=Streptomyces rimosus TaxID=1927 RepID=UPI0006B2A953|nr:hypothetical protein [Streptomyces rimosus]KOT94502.1 hypothetical protein ADK70_12555 [Streptomyces rimosus subsp. pseudoverticillatus]